MKLNDLGGDMPFIKDLGAQPGQDSLTTLAMGEEDSTDFCGTPPHGGDTTGLHASLEAHIRSQVSSLMSGGDYTVKPFG